MGRAFKPSRSRGNPCRTGVTGIAGVPHGRPKHAESGIGALRGGAARGKGTASNPVQRRLSEHDAENLVRSYGGGVSIDALARRFSVHRTTVMDHLRRSGVQRRRIVRKLTDRTVRQAATLYRRGESLKVVAARFGIDARTLAREFQNAGVQIRPRRGWPPSA